MSCVDENPTALMTQQELCWDIYSNLWTHPPPSRPTQWEANMGTQEENLMKRLGRVNYRLQWTPFPQHHYKLCENKIRKLWVYFCKYQKWVQDNRCKRYSLSRQEPSPWLPDSHSLRWLQSVCFASRVSGRLCGLTWRTKASLMFCSLKFVRKP